MMHMLAIGLSCVAGALVLMTFGLAVHAFLMGHVYQSKVRQIKELTGNQWKGTRLANRFNELDSDYQFLQLLIATFGNVLTVFYLTTGFGRLEVVVPFGIIVAVFLLGKQVKVLRLLRMSLDEHFLLSNYVSAEKLQFLMDINEEKLSALKIGELLKSRVTAPQFLESLFVLDALLDEAFRTKKILEQEMDEEVAYEQAELMESYLTSVDTLRPLFYTLLMAVGHNEKLSAKAMKRQKLKEQALTLHRMASIFAEEERGFDNTTFLTLNRLMEDESVPEELRMKAKETMERIHEKLEAAFSERKVADKRLNAEASIETARRLYGITD